MNPEESFGFLSREMENYLSEMRPQSRSWWWYRACHPISRWQFCLNRVNCGTFLGARNWFSYGVHEWLYTKISCCFTGIWSITSKLPEAYLVRAWMGGFSLAVEAALVISLIRWLCAILNISEVLEIRLRWSSGAKLVLCFIVRISVSIKEKEGTKQKFVHTFHQILCLSR